MESDELLRETYRLSLENNKLLHKMRRSAYWSRLVSFIVYGALLLAPIWFYMQYLAPVVDQMFEHSKTDARYRCASFGAVLGYAKGVATVHREVHAVAVAKKLLCLGPDRTGDPSLFRGMLYQLSYPSFVDTLSCPTF